MVSLPETIELVRKKWELLKQPPTRKPLTIEQNVIAATNRHSPRDGLLIESRYEPHLIGTKGNNSIRAYCHVDHVPNFYLAKKRCLAGPWDEDVFNGAVGAIEWIDETPTRRQDQPGFTVLYVQSLYRKSEDVTEVNDELHQKYRAHTTEMLRELCKIGKKYGRYIKFSKRVFEQKKDPTDLINKIKSVAKQEQLNLTENEQGEVILAPPKKELPGYLKKETRRVQNR